METADRPIVGVTMGDPAGIGPEIVAKAYATVFDVCRPLVIGDADVLMEASRHLAVDRSVTPVDSIEAFQPSRDTIPVLDFDDVGKHMFGVVREEYGRASLEYVETAISLVQSGSIDAIATAPIHKGAIARADSPYSGHTPLLADRTGTEHYTMMLIEGSLRVTHVSTHVPLSQACELVTTDRVFQTISLSAMALQDFGIDEPTLAVAGLNPHAGDGTILGAEDEEEIAPAVRMARAKGIAVDGPQSPDTVFARAANGDYDCVISMYHDQGHIPIKMLGFSGDGTVSGVNVTVGLPITRTSVDHGTAFDIAGEGVASEVSLVEAVRTAVRLVE